MISVIAVSLKLAADETQTADQWVTRVVDSVGLQQKIIVPYEGPKSVVSFTKVDHSCPALVSANQK